MQNYSNEGFEKMGIAPNILKRITSLGFVKPMPIQFKAIPIATSGEDVVGIAQTGSGKTLAFAIPIIQKVLATKRTGLVLLPTRELAIQVDETIRKVGDPFGVKTALVMGGTNARPQLQKLRAKPQIIVATPGRLIDYIDRKQVYLSDLGMLVLDEADRMLDMGFAPQIKRILAVVPVERQTMLFSATMPEKISAMAQNYMKKPLRIEVAPPGKTADKIDQEVFIVPKEGKVDLLLRTLKEYKGTILVFTRTKYGAKKLAHKIRQDGHSADELHSNRSHGQRQKALKGFASGAYRILVATDIAARGIDVKDIELVVNFDLPEQTEDYTHRIGRTGRAGKSGKAISFAAPDQKGGVVQIQNLINMVLPVKSPTGEELESIVGKYPKARNPRRSCRGSFRSGGNRLGARAGDFRKKKSFKHPLSKKGGVSRGSSKEGKPQYAGRKRANRGRR